MTSRVSVVSRSRNPFYLRSGFQSGPTTIIGQPVSETPATPSPYPATTQALKDKGYQITKTKLKSNADEALLTKRGYRPYLLDEHTGELKEDPLGVWAKAPATPQTDSGILPDEKQGGQIPQAAPEGEGAKEAETQPSPGAAAPTAKVKDVNQEKTDELRPVEKQPWEMMADEVQARINHTGDFASRPASESYEKTANSVNEHRRIVGALGKMWSYDAGPDISAGAIQEAHKAVVEKALSEGKPVPPLSSPTTPTCKRPSSTLRPTKRPRRQRSPQLL